MSHIDGHIEKPPQSVGTLVIKNENGKIVARLPFIPPSSPWLSNGSLTVGMKVGFHPLTLEKDSKGKPTKVIAINIVKLQDHKNAENKMKTKLGLDTSLEQFFHSDRGNGKKQLETELAKGDFNEEHHDVMRKTLDYLGTPDFDLYYLKGDEADSEHAKAKVISIMKP